MYSIIKNKNMNYLEIVKNSTIIFLKKLMPIFVLLLLVNIPIRLIEFFIWTFIIDRSTHMVLSFAIDILGMICILLSSISIILIVYEEINGNEVFLIEVFKKTIFLWRNSIETSIVQCLIVLLLMILLIIPGLIWLVYYTFALQIVVLKGIKGKAALKYSKFLVSGRWWKVCLTLLPFTIIYFIIYKLLNIPKNVFGSVNELALIIIPFQEVFTKFIEVVTCVLFINLNFIYGKESVEDVEKPLFIDYFISKTNVKIDDTEDCNDYDSESLKCSECGVFLIESDEFCPACESKILK